MENPECWITFCIPLLPKAVAKDWTIVENLLRDTLRSLDAQTDRRFSVVLAAHEMPVDPKDYSFSLSFIQAKWNPDDLVAGKLRDKRWKRKLLYDFLRSRGGGYAMFLDADDFVSNKLVAYALGEANPNGYLITRGYAYDRSNVRIAPIPGAWSGSFDSVCGSCTIINFRIEDLPASHENNPDAISRNLKRHSEWKDVMTKSGRPLLEVPFPAAVYVLNHSQNLHSSIALNREEQVPRKIARSAIEITPALVAEFSLPC